MPDIAGGNTLLIDSFFEDHHNGMQALKSSSVGNVLIHGENRWMPSPRVKNAARSPWTVLPASLVLRDLGMDWTESKAEVGTWSSSSPAYM